jgi:hypothetical protein
MFRLKFPLAALAACMATTPASGQSLRDIRAEEAENAAIAREASYTSEVCGRTISAGIDWPSAKNWSGGAGLAEACDGALGAVEATCRAGRKRLVASFVCAGDGAGPNLSGGTLRYGASRSGNSFAETKSYLDGVR